MKNNKKQRGSVLLVSVFVSALFGAVVIGMIQLNTEETMLMTNHIELAKARAIAEAGLNDAYYQIRQSSSWTTGFTNKSFGGGSYTVTVSGTLPARSLVSTGTAASGFKARIESDITIGTLSPYSVTITEVRIND